MYFVGRSRETNFIIKALERGENVIVSGRFGMGRTSLLKHISEKASNKWRFVFIDFSKTPADACRHLIAELFPAYAAKQGDAYIKYKPCRFQILNRELEVRRQHVLVLDNIEKVTRHKLALLQMMTFEKRFLFVAITASFLPESQYHQLKVALLATCRITLGHMSPSSTKEFFAYFSKKNNFNWTEDYINNISRRTQGYPLSMKEIVAEERKKTTERIGK
jgi:replication-associated recombination protein RarA